MPQHDEKAFKRWYAGWAKKAGLDPNPDDPRHKYDYRAAFRAGAVPKIDNEDGLYHWPSQFKADDHPNRVVKGVDTKALDAKGFARPPLDRSARDQTRAPSVLPPKPTRTVGPRTHAPLAGEAARRVYDPSIPEQGFDLARSGVKALADYAKENPFRTAAELTPVGGIASALFEAGKAGAEAYSKKGSPLAALAMGATALIPGGKSARALAKKGGRLSAAAIRMPDGTVLEGTSHLDAMELGKVSNSPLLKNATEGYVDQSGAFLTLDEGGQRLKHLGLTGDAWKNARSEEVIHTQKGWAPRFEKAPRSKFGEFRPDSVVTRGLSFTRRTTPDGTEFTAKLGDKPAGKIVVQRSTNRDPEGTPFGKLHADWVEVVPELRRKGIATALYDHAEKELGEQLVPSVDQSPSARAFWNKRRKTLGDSVVAKGVPAVRAILDNLQHPEGSRLPRITDVDPERGAQMARAYEKLPKNDPAAKEAYDALNAEVALQMKAMKDAGYSVEFVDADPYKSSAEMMADVRDNKRLKVFKTPEGGEFHPYMTPEQNNHFRAVHDWLAHAGEGHQFGVKGEENAYRVHASTLSPLARRALATETRGQNSWVNWGPNKHLPPKERPFAEQKAALWPDELQGDYDAMPDEVKQAVNEAFFNGPSSKTTISMEPNRGVDAPPRMPTPWDEQLKKIGALDSIPGKLASEEIARHRKGTYLTVKKGEVKEVPFKVQSARAVLPFADEDFAATRLPDGRVFRGSDHAAARSAAVRAWERTKNGPQPDVYTDGFALKDGTFVTRAEGTKLFEKARQTTRHGEAHSADVDDARRVRGDSVVARVPQAALNRPRFPKTSEADLSRVQEITARALRSPAGQAAFERGSAVPNAPDWYNTEQMRQMAGDVLGEQGNDAVDHLMKMMAASTALGTPRNNLKRASLWHAGGASGEIDPSQLVSGTKFPVPEKFGHFTQSSQQPAIARVMATGEIDPALGPKQASFAENLNQNWKPATLDVWMARLLRDIAPDLEKTKTIKSSLTNKEYGSTAEALNPRHYSAVEKALQDYAAEQHKAGRLNVRPGYDATAPAQSVLWHGVNDAARKNPRTLQQTFEDLLKSSADVWGTDTRGANKLFWQGQPFELPLGSRLMR